MKQLKHKWSYFADECDYIPYDSNCLICGINSLKVWDKMTLEKKVYLADLSERIQQEIDYYNEFSPCLTEEEYIIKGILE